MNEILYFLRISKEIVSIKKIKNIYMQIICNNFVNLHKTIFFFLRTYIDSKKKKKLTIFRRETLALARDCETQTLQNVVKIYLKTIN